MSAVTTPQQSHYIEFRNVYKTFDHPVLVDVSFHADTGQTLAIIGRSGVGKSVSLSHIMGFLKPDKGRVIVSYTDITDADETVLRHIRKRVTMVFQSGALFDSLTVGENILFSLELREDYDEKNKEDVVNGLLSMVDLLEYRDHYPSDEALSLTNQEYETIHRGRWPRSPNASSTMSRRPWSIPSCPNISPT